MSRSTLLGERLSVGEICTRVVTVAFGFTRLCEAARLMRENHVGALVVVEDRDDRRVVVGVLTDRDIVTAAVARDLDPQVLCVADIMSTDLVTADEDESVIDLLRIMRAKGVRRVPVIGAGADLVGIVTLDDVLDILSQELALVVAAINSEGRRERQRLRALKPQGRL